MGIIGHHLGCLIRMLVVNSMISGALGGLPSHFGKCDNGFIWVVLYKCLRSVLYFLGTWVFSFSFG